MTGGERQQYLVALLGTLASSALQRVQTSADKPDSKVLSEQASVVYKLLHEKVAFLKKQQWTITNYIALIYAAIFAVTKELRPTSTLNYILIAAAIVACLYSLWVLSMVQRDLGKTRRRLDNANRNIFGYREYNNWEWNQTRIHTGAVLCPLPADSCWFWWSGPQSSSFICAACRRRRPHNENESRRKSPN